MRIEAFSSSRACINAIVFVLAISLSGCSLPLAQKSSMHRDEVAQEKEDRQGLFDLIARSTPMRFQRDNQDAISILEKYAEIDIRWPLELVEITSPFGPRKRDYHEGIDLRAPVGTRIYAAHDGVVALAANRARGYGRLIVLQSDLGLSTAYGHISKILVKNEQNVKKGELIALSGRSGRATGPHLHFEFRDEGVPMNPEKMMRVLLGNKSPSLDRPLRTLASEQ